MKCTARGSTALVEGHLQGEDASRAGFQPTDATTFKRMFGIGRRSLRAYGCIRCKHLQFAIEFTEKDLERYLKFEGQRPGVLERISSGEGGIQG